MPSSSCIIKDGQVTKNEWQLVTHNEEPIPTGKVIVSLEIWQAQKSSLADNPVGLWISNDKDLNTIEEDFSQFEVIAIDFPGFMDGRGFSIGRLLRDRYHYQGEIRATGHIIRDQLCYLRRCGFNAFDLGEDANLETSLASLNDFTDGYQTSADQKTPLFRRRA